MIRKYVAEALGTGLLLVSVVGSGIMGDSLSGGNTAVALLANAVATGCALYFLITVLGPISGAHFNPAVTLAFALRREITTGAALIYVLCQVGGGILGVWLTHIQFDLALLQASTTARTGIAQWVSEALATFGLLFVIFGGLRHRPEAVPTLVAIYITGAYWFTASTSFANPAVTIARGFTDTFAGISPVDVAPFVAVQLLTALLVTGLLAQLFQGKATEN